MTNPCIQLIQADITKLEVDTIVNAANSSLLGGGGVDGAIHRAAGPDLLHECRKLAGCRTGQAKITKGYNLPARHIIHTVGPVWKDGSHNEPRQLADCYRNSLRIAAQNQLKSIAFPAISCGIYRFPHNKACEIALREISEFLEQNATIGKVIICCFDQQMFDIYEQNMVNER